MKKAISLMLIFAFIAVISADAYAQNAPAKLGRGIMNTLTGFLEVPLKIIRISKSDGFPMGVSVGLIKGIGWGLYRTLVGVYEVLTFPIPAPAEYQAITDPPTLFTDATMAGDPSMRKDFKPLADELKGGSSSSGSRSVTSGGSAEETK